MRICSIIPLKNAVKLEPGSEVIKPIVGSKNIVLQLMKTSKTKTFAKLKSLKSIITENVFDKTSIIYLSDVSEHPDLAD